MVVFLFSRVLGLLIPVPMQAGKMGSSALAISLPFSCIFGLLASMTAATMGKTQLVYSICYTESTF